MKKILPLNSRPWPVVLTLVLAMTVLSTGAVLAGDQDLEELLKQVGEEYATAYASPFIEAFGPNQNSAMYQSAHIPWGGLTFGIGVKVMGTHLNEADQSFQKTIVVDDLGNFEPGLSGQSGTAILSGPTIFGDTGTTGSVTLVPDAGGPPIAIAGIPGLVDTRFVPFFAPEASVGDIFGLRGTVRYFPEVNLGSYGKTKYFGYGLQWSPNGLLENLPVDLMVGFFDQELKVGTLIDSSAQTYFAAVSKSFGPITAYAGYASEESDMTVAYTWVDTGEAISFDASAQQESRFTVGAKLAMFNVEMAHGDLTTYSAGAMFGF